MIEKQFKKIITSFSHVKVIAKVKSIVYNSMTLLNFLYEENQNIKGNTRPWFSKKKIYKKKA